jgi:four helix bundle protein
MGNWRNWRNWRCGRLRCGRFCDIRAEDGIKGRVLDGMHVASFGPMDEATIRRLEARTRAFAVSAIRLRRALARHQEFWDILGQLTRAACSVAANHRAMTRARSTREFAAKLHIVHEEADEAAHWLSLLHEGSDDEATRLGIRMLLDEADQLRNIFGRARTKTRRGIL